ncbi:MAG: tRNA (N(6)-L-threonylcarbamoyladenosine(37)-C(2))-methylthiotransferase MtaB [Defluviitaleaceae bacterium]|nr:tRNA (N(6)-L-threonylcarbamoyladenosine(37)-C(2))-methylthiotransferase MtaB [Defluviitaleaceae bacterium]
MKNITVAAHTLGCKVNQCDTEALLSRLEGMGYGIIKFDEIADIYIVNTCTVTHVSDKKSRQMINRAKRRNPGAFVAVCGCMVKDKPCPEGVDFVFDARSPEDFFAKAQEWAAEINILQPSSVGRIFRPTEKFLAEDTAGSVQSTGFAPGHGADVKSAGTVEQNRPPQNAADYKNRNSQETGRGSQPPNFVTGHEANMESSGAVKRHGRAARRLVKVQDGCNRFCAYCIVPYVRGRVVSRPVEDIIDEVVAHVEAGSLEVVLTGIQVASYGEDTGSSLAALIGAVAAVPGLMRLRLSSFDPWVVDDGFVQAVAGAANLCDHFHLSLQSGCDSTLQRMNRRYSTVEYAAAVAKLRAAAPKCAITTDIIVGFPGETAQDFADSLAFVEKIGFARLHVFEFSKREGTAAAEFPDQIPQAIKNTRGAEMRELAARLQDNFLKAQIGRQHEVLFETASKGYSTNYCHVKTETSKNLANSIRRLKITGLEGSTLVGE